jgi:hypothetical protein
MLAFGGVWLLFAIIALVLLLVRMPAAWVEPLPHPLVLRGALVLVAMLALRGVGALVYTRLPSAAFLSGRTVAFRERGHRRRVHLRDVAGVVVDLRPPPDGEVFVLQLHDGTEHDLCPVRWPGAGRLYAAIARRVSPRRGISSRPEVATRDPGESLAAPRRPRRR